MDIAGPNVNCASGAGSFDGVWVMGGVGTFVEQNRIWECANGITIFEGLPIDLANTRDVILRDNHLYDVDKGINLEIEDPEDYFWCFWEKDLVMAFLMYDTLPSSIGRLIVSSNIIELSTTATDAVGIRIAWPLANPNPFQAIQQFIARQNRIQHVDGQAGSLNTIGIDLASIKQAIVEENVISIGTDPTNPDSTKAIKRTATVSTIKTFNNHSSGGLFLGCWNGTSHDGDPITDMQDALLGI